MKDPKSNYQRFLAGAYCNRLDEEVLAMIAATKEYLATLNAPQTSEADRRRILHEMLGSIGPHSNVEQHFTCQCGKHIFIGEKSVINMHCTLMDENHIHIGNQVLIAPHVQFYTAIHAVHADERFTEGWDEASGELFFKTRALPITVEDNVWIGGGAILPAGVTIGANSVIGAGSVVTESIPANCVAAGNPCRVIRRLAPAYTVRPLTPADIPEMRELFQGTVRNVNSRDYTQEEVEDWASCGKDEAHLSDLLSAHHFIAAFDEQGRMIGFSSMNSAGYLHSMFVHKEWQGRGVATLLLSEVERKAREYGVREITSEVSLTARPFFEKKGYQVVTAQKHRANRLELTNFVMRKQI